MTKSPQIVFRNVDLFDGTGAPPVRGDLAVEGDRIVAIGAGGVGADQVIDGTGLALAPGFIDAHTHDDRVLLSDPDLAPKASQGVTTVIVGNCGVSLAPLIAETPPPQPLDLLGGGGWWRFADFASYLDALDAAPAALNAACLVGHMTLRVGAMDRTDRPASEAEIAVMAERLDQALSAGAIGLSTGLFYPLGRAAPTEEVIALARVAHRHGALYATHMRNEGDQILDSLAETFRIGREADLPVVVSHHKLAGRPNHGRSSETLPIIAAEQALRPVGLDVYPYAAASTMLSAERLAISDKVLVTHSRPVPEAAGRDLAELAAEWGVDPVTAVERLSPAGAVYFIMSEADVETILKFPPSMIGSDGLMAEGARPHPRLWGTFPRVLGHYARGRGLFPLEIAIHKMTGLTAGHFGLRDRGVLRVGAYADLVLFDPATIIDRATYDDPETPADGIHSVWVNGRPVWRDGGPTGERPGRALRRQHLDPPMASWRPSGAPARF